MDSPLISIGITCFNAEDSIAKAVASALAQDWPNKEILIADDCSKDGSWAVLQELKAAHPEIRLFRHEENKGFPSALNTLLGEAKGAFFAIFDDDDVSLPARIGEQYRRITEYERDFAAGAPVLCHTARVQLYADGEERIEPTMGQTEGRLAPHGIAVAKRILAGEPLQDGYGSCACCSQMARLSTYRQLGGFDPKQRRCCDTEFSIRAGAAGCHFAGLAEPLVRQTMTPTPDKSLAVVCRNFQAMLDKHRALVGNERHYLFCRRFLEAKEAWLENRKGRFVLLISRLVVLNPVRTLRRLALAVPNIGQNRAFSKFHLDSGR